MSSESEVKVVCWSCDKPLLNVLIIDPYFNLKTTVIVDCPYCKQQSFRQEFNGNVMIDPVDGLFEIENDVTPLNGSYGVKATEFQSHIKLGKKDG